MPDRSVLVVGESLVDIVHGAGRADASSTPAAAPPTSRSRSRGSAGRCGSRPRGPTTSAAGCWPSTSRSAGVRAGERPARAGPDRDRGRDDRRGRCGVVRVRPGVAARRGRRRERRRSCTCARSAPSSSRAPTRSSTCCAGCRGPPTVSYDVNARPAITGTGPDLVARVERTAAVADLVKASDEDLASLYPDLDITEAAAHLLALGPTAVVVTRAATAPPGSGRTAPSRSRPCPSRSPTRSARATRSAPPSSTRCGTAARSPT